MVAGAVQPSDPLGEALDVATTIATGAPRSTRLAQSS